MSKSETSYTHRTVVEEINIAIFAFDVHHKLRLANRAAEVLLAKSAGKILDCDAADIGLADCLEGEATRMLNLTFPGSDSRWGLRLTILVQESPDLTLACDAAQIEQLIINLVKNAVEAALEQRTAGRSQAGGRLRWFKANGAAEVLVEDAGPGIAQATNLFVPFFTTKPDGSGIGLVLCRAATGHAIEQKRYQFAKDSIEPQLAVKQAQVDRYRALARLRHDELEALAVRSSMEGVLQLVPVEVGAQVQPGSNLARVADPTKLKAEIRVAETQARDILIGQLAMIDTRNGIVEGKVSRIDPSVQNGTVTVDVHLTGDLSRTGARPDLSVDGTIELERLDEVIFVGRPAFGQERSTVGIFKLESDSVYANRTQVRRGHRRGAIDQPECGPFSFADTTSRRST